MYKRIYKGVYVPMILGVGEAFLNKVQREKTDKDGYKNVNIPMRNDTINKVKRKINYENICHIY